MTDLIPITTTVAPKIKQLANTHGLKLSEALSYGIRALTGNLDIHNVKKLEKANDLLQAKLINATDHIKILGDKLDVLEKKETG